MWGGTDSQFIVLDTIVAQASDLPELLNLASREELCIAGHSGPNRQRLGVCLWVEVFGCAWSEFNFGSAVSHPTFGLAPFCIGGSYKNGHLL